MFTRIGGFLRIIWARKKVVNHWEVRGDGRNVDGSYDKICCSCSGPKVWVAIVMAKMARGWDSYQQALGGNVSKQAEGF